MTSIKKKIKGGLDLFFLFGDGIKAFEGTRTAAVKSLWVVLLLYPVSPLFLYFYPPKGMEQHAYSAIFLTATAQYIASIIVGAMIAYVFASLLKQSEKFWLYFQAANWTGLAGMVVAVPFMLLALSGFVTRLEMDRIFVVVAVYGYVVAGCIAYKAFKTNWQLAGAFACFNLVTAQAVWDMLYNLQGIPDPWG